MSIKTISQIDTLNKQQFRLGISLRFFSPVWRLSQKVGTFTNAPTQAFTVAFTILGLQLGYSWECSNSKVGAFANALTFWESLLYSSLMYKFRRSRKCSNFLGEQLRHFRECPNISRHFGKLEHSRMPQLFLGEPPGFGEEVHQGSSAGMRRCPLGRPRPSRAQALPSIDSAGVQRNCPATARK